MNENDAKKLRCCGPCPENTGRPCFANKELGRIEELVVDAKELDKSDIIYLCSGSECMGWIDTGEYYEYPDSSSAVPIVSQTGYCCYRKVA